MKNIAIVWGGYSSEMIVSAKSMQGIYGFMDKQKYNVYKVQISRDAWTVDVEGEVFDVNKNDFSFTDSKDNITKFDFAYITIHGTPGEDGRLQGYFDMINVPYSTCGMMASALTINKYLCNKFLKNFDIKVAESHYIKKGESFDAQQIISDLGLPIFVKPNTGGSSFATTKVKSIEELPTAIDTALQETDEVIIESFMQGREVTCGCYKIKDKEVILPITEVITSNEFFDYNAKYEGEVLEVTPAQISEVLTNKIQELTSKIYNLVDAKGIIRVDYIIKEDNIPYLLEVNTTPGMTATSFIPQQVEAAGLSMTDVLNDIIENEYQK
mgnify:CR=1 FL=1